MSSPLPIIILPSKLSTTATSDKPKINKKQKKARVRSMLMESISTSSSTQQREGSSPIRLAEHLEEKQESFNLEAYLLERGYAEEGLYSEGSVGCFSSSHSRKKNEFLRRSARSFNLCRRKRKKKSTYADAKYSEIGKALCKKLGSIGEVIGLKGRRIKHEEFDDTIQGRRNGKQAVSIVESERLSSASLSTTEFSPHSEIHMEDASTSVEGSQRRVQPSHPTSESATDRRSIQWSIVEESKQCSPDSVLDEIVASPIDNDESNRQDEDQSTSSFSLPKRPTEDSIFSASLLDLIIRARQEKQETSGPCNDTCTGNTSSKKALQQTRQLLFDCVREAVESQGRQRKTEQLMGPEKLGRIICDNMTVWDRHSTNIKTVNRLLRSDLLSSFHEWGNFEGHKGDVVKKVGDQILEQMKDEMVEEMIDFYICKTQDILMI